MGRRLGGWGLPGCPPPPGAPGQWPVPGADQDPGLLFLSPGGKGALEVGPSHWEGRLCGSLSPLPLRVTSRPGVPLMVLPGPAPSGHEWGPDLHVPLRVC